jgi:hypothetical protein
MIKLINERDDMHHKYTVVNRIEMEIDSEATLDEMLTAYREFLLACGYQVNGELAVVDDDNL